LPHSPEMGFQRLACTLIFLHLRLVLDLQHPEARRDAHTREDLRELRQNLHLLPNKPGRVNVCPQCSAPSAELAVIVRKPRKRRQKTVNELVADAERKLHHQRKMNELIFGNADGPVQKNRERE